MSQIDEKSPKHCAQKQALNTHKLNKKLFIYLSTFIITILSLILLVWLILHPTKPKFSIKQAQLYQLNITSPSFLINSTIQLTLQSTNPNKKSGIYYEELLLHASYADQMITPETSISPFYQDHDETNILSALLVGNQQPVDSSLVYQVQRDRGTGKIGVSFKGMGKLRWKVGTWVSGRYRFTVNCVTVMPFGPSSFGHGTQCSTSI